jgi:hypothetical protein
MVGFSGTDASAGLTSSLRSRQIDVVNMLRSERPAVYCFGRTKHGTPKHPLYLKTGTPLEVFR